VCEWAAFWSGSLKVNLRILYAWFLPNPRTFSNALLSRWNVTRLLEGQNLARLLALVDILVDSPFKTEVVTALSRLPNIEELYEVTGNSDIVSLVSGTDIDEIRNLLKNDIRKIPGIRNVLTSIVLNSTRTMKTSQ